MNNSIDLDLLVINIEKHGYLWRAIQKDSSEIVELKK